MWANCWQRHLNFRNSEAIRAKVLAIFAGGIDLVDWPMKQPC
jgi:hypothetical protein